MLIGGLDIGTTGCKVTVFDSNDGKLICNSYREYEKSSGCPEYEINAADVWKSVCETIKEAAKAAGNIDALGITSFGETFVLLDAENNVLANSMLYTDKRGAQEAKMFYGRSFELSTGIYPDEMFSIPKIMWMKNNKPEIFSKAKRILLYQDFIVYMLTGKAQMDYSLATRTMGFDISKKSYNKDIFDIAGINMNMMSVPVPSGTPAGKVTNSELGLKDTLIVTCCQDQLAALTGAGVFETGNAIDGSGTVECIVPVFDKIPEEKSMFKKGYAVLPHIIDGKYICYMLTYTGGSILKWFRDNFAADTDYRQLDDSMPDEPTGILTLPHFAGAATPYMDKNSKGIFSGITLETTKSDIYKSLLEGVAYEMLLNIKETEKYGITINRLYATGGGANSKKWLQIKADITGKEFIPVKSPQVGNTGNAMITGVAAGAFKDIYQAKEIMVKEGTPIKPDARRHEIYMRNFEKYNDLYNSNKNLFII